jgi:NTE family protein
MAIRPRQYSDILVGQYEIGKMIRVNRKNDEYTISNKIFDFSSKTIKQLRESGYNNIQDPTDVEYQGELF